MIKAILRKNEYPDLELGKEYEVARMYANGHILLKDNKKLYLGVCFRFVHNGKYISKKEAYRLQQLEKVKQKMGMV